MWGTSRGVKISSGNSDLKLESSPVLGLIFWGVWNKLKEGLMMALEGINRSLYY